MKIQGVNGQPELNGQEGSIVKYDTENDRWVIKMKETGKGKGIKAENLVLLTHADGTPAAAAADGAAAGGDEKKDDAGAAKPADSAAAAGGDAAAFVKGDKVKVVGVTSTPELNGEEGTIVKFDDEKNRWIIKLDSTGKGKGIKTENLEKVATAGEGAKIVDGVSTGEEGSAAKKKEAGNQQGNPDLKPGARIKIFGIRSTPELNDQTGTIVKFDEKIDRWIVKIDSTGKGKGVKAENLEVIPAEGGEGEHKQEAVSIGLTSKSNTTRSLDRGKMTGQVGDVDVEDDDMDEELSEDEVDESSLFTPGDRVRVGGIISTPELNGLKGTILKFDANINRWILKMDDTGKGKGIKTENLELIENNNVAMVKAGGENNNVVMVKQESADANAAAAQAAGIAPPNEANEVELSDADHE